MDACQGLDINITHFECLLTNLLEYIGLMYSCILIYDSNLLYVYISAKIMWISPGIFPIVVPVCLVLFQK